MRRIHYQPFLKLCCCIILLLLAGCQQAPTTLKIGLVAPFEGLDRALGYEALFAVKVAVQQRNAAGGVAGYQIEVVALNDFNEPTEAQIQAKALLADPDIMGVVGHFSSAATLAAMPIYQEAEVALSVPWTIAPATSAEDRRGVVCVAAHQAETAARLSQLQHQLGLQPVLTLQQSGLSHSAADINAAAAIQIETTGVSAGELIAQLRQADISKPIFGQVNTGSHQVIQVAGELANGFIFVSPGPAMTDLTAATEFTAAYQALAGLPPTPRAILTYDATNLLLDSIEQAMLKMNIPNRVAVSRAINQMSRHGLTGEIAFDRQGQRLNAPVWVYQIVEGRYPGVAFTPDK